MSARSAGALAAFLPIDRRRELAGGRSLPDRVHGAALFADISGFTPLTAALAAELGPQRGAEELTHHLNRAYTALIAEVHRHGGSVIFFSGDAITCWFDDMPPDSDFAEVVSPAAEIALACAHALQAEVARMAAIETPGGSTIRFGLKIAVVAGDARRFLVGDPDHYVLEVLAGSTVDRLARAEKLARRGEVIAPVQLISELPRQPGILSQRREGDEQFAVVSRPEHLPVLPTLSDSPGLDAEVVRPWVLPPVYERLLHSPAEFLAELRPITVLFLKFEGIDYDRDDQAGEQLDSFVRAVQYELARYQGYILQLTMGDKGSYMLVSFGAPIAHEDDTARAAAAALALRDLPARFDFLDDCRIGISRGLVRSGAYGSLSRRVYGSQGAEVNIAARLMAAARPGRILISERVAAVVEEEFELLRQPPLDLKGVSAQFIALELVGRRAAVRRLPDAQASDQPIGREHEQALLVEALAEVASGAPAASVLVIEGDAGIGKTFLIADLLRHAGEIDAEVVSLVSAGDAVEQSTPYFAWRGIFERLLDFDAGDGDPARLEQLISGLPLEQQVLAPLLGVVLPVELPDTPLTEQMSGEARQESTQQLLSSVLRSRVAGRPLLIILDDAHWLDSASCALAERIQREVRPLLLLLAARTMGPDAPPHYLELTSAPATRRLTLDTLPPAAIEQLVCRRLGARSLPEPVAGLIHEKAEGHPFFSEELAYALRDGGFIDVVDGECRLTGKGHGLEALDFPSTIQGVITSRIDLLPPLHQSTVKVASVIGRIFAYRVLHNVYPDPREVGRVRECLDELNRLDITPQEAPEPNLAYIFRQYVTQDVVYNLMTFQQRRQLHRNVALLYEREGAGDPARQDPLLGHHWSLAGENDKAVHYYARAGESAFRDYANQEAITLLTRALDLGGDEPAPAMRAHRHRLAAEAAYRLTRMEHSREHYLQALALLDHAVPTGSLGRGMGLLGQLIRQLWHRLRRLPGPDAPLERGRMNLLEAARAYEGVSEIYYNAGDFLSAFYCVMAALNLAELAGPSPELARGYANMCATLGTVSLNGAAERYRRRAIHTAAESDDLPTRAWIQIPLSVHSLWVGNWDRAEAEIGEALDIYSRLRDWRRWSVAAWVWPQVAESRGELDHAAGLWEQLYEVALRSRDTRHQVRCRGGQFFNFMALGKPDEALACLSDVGATLRDNPEMMPVEERLWHAVNAKAALHLGDAGKAREEAHALLGAIERARFKFDLLPVFASAAEVFLALWEQDRTTVDEAQLGCRALNGYARTYRFARPRALRCQGRLEWLAGKETKALKLYARSVAQAEALGMGHEVALSREYLKRASGDRHFLK
jgi:class 3 adenylate cyclase/tetratricopeptide (TPR) repeat protein